MNRRRWIQLGVAGSGLAAVGLGAWLYAENPHPEQLRLAVLVERLKLLQDKTVMSETAWPAGKVFYHCAQSINFSMTGFPEHKSAFFKRAIGGTAFNVFAHIGKMHHNLTEVIPGAPAIADDTTTEAGLQALLDAIDGFSRWQKDLQAHFAFGELSWQEFEVAHVLHVNNHFNKLVVSIS